MIEMLLWAVFVIALATAFVALCAWRAGVEYDAWQAEFDKEGIKTSLAPVMQGGEIVGYTLVGERRARPR